MTSWSCIWTVRLPRFSPARESLSRFQHLSCPACSTFYSVLVISQQQMKGSVTRDALSLSQILLLFSIRLRHPGWDWALPTMCLSHSFLLNPFRLMAPASAHEFKRRLDAVVCQELRSLTKQHESRVVWETFCPYHTQICALYVCVCVRLFFHGEQKIDGWN